MTGKYGGGLTALLNREREKKAEPTRAPETEVPETRVPETEVPETQAKQTQVSELRPPRSESAALPVTEVPETEVSRTPVRRTRVRESEVPEPTGRFLQVEHAILDDFLPRLEPYEQLVYLRLFRLTAGFNRPKCTVSHERLAEKTHLSVSTIKRVCARLEANGYIRSRAVLGGPHAQRGSEFELVEPASLLRTQVRETQVRRTQVPRTDMKDRKDMIEKAPDAHAPATSIYEIRTIAARLFEAHRGEVGFDHDRLRELVREALIGQGREPDEGAIEEAIRGMAG